MTTLSLHKRVRVLEIKIGSWDQSSRLVRMTRRLESVGVFLSLAGWLIKCWLQVNPNPNLTTDLSWL